MEEFGDISESTRRNISRIISKDRKLNNDTLQLFLDPQEERLELFDCTLITSDGFNAIAYLGANLRALTLQMCGKITDSELKLLSDRCDQVQELVLDGPFLCSDDGFKAIFSLPLKTLRIGHAAKMTGDSLQELVEKCPQLEELSFEYCGRLKDGARAISRLSKLTALTLNHVGGMDNETLAEIIGSVGSNLRKLSLNGYCNMSDDILKLIATECRHLSDLSLSEASSLTADGFGQFFTLSKACLKSISLHRNVSLTDSVVISLVNQHGPTLENINLNGLDDLTVQALKTLAMGCPRLLSLDVSWIRLVDDEFLEKLLLFSRGLKCIKVYGCNRLTEVTMKKTLCNGAGLPVLVYGNEFD